MSYITHTSMGSFCDACGAVLSQEEIEWECCDCCGGKGFGAEDDDDLGDDWFAPEMAVLPVSGGKL
jgi:hypothetical protein